jgi:hypothetical protein
MNAPTSIPKSEVTKLLGCSERQVERYAKEGRLSVTYERKDGRRTAVYGREAVLRLKEELDAPIHKGQFVAPTRNGHAVPTDADRQALLVQSPTALARQHPTRPEPTDERLVGLLAEGLGLIARAQQLPLDRKLGLNVVETSLLTGLPQTFIREAIRAKRLKARLRGRAYHIKRRDLDVWYQSL